MTSIIEMIFRWRNIIHGNYPIDNKAPGTSEFKVTNNYHFVIKAFSSDVINNIDSMKLFLDGVIYYIDY